ncbi:hypothetical protein E2562_030111 [Oryza meyeriana var. granulata]|uniref:Uncharacterized protein n=1 Tax=Oryza meyeriana var. granulata TaxID=110450 RepID=A0A6G1CV66_9ORYZ|nr:hypothetical protein E2562_030111 [Oryza meyeriana var. granulata]
MCPRATAQHGGAAMARAAGVAAAAAAQCFGEEEYIDLDLSSCRGFEFRVCRSAVAAPCGDQMLFRGRLHKASVPRLGAKQQEADAGGGGCGGGRRSTATVAPWQQPHAAAAGIRNSQPAARLQQPEGVHTGRRKKAARTVHAKLQASRAFFRSLFARTSCSDEQCHGVGVRATRSRTATAPGGIKNGGAAGACKPGPFGQIRNSYGSCSGRAAAAPTTLRSSIEQEKLMDEEEHAASVRQRKSFSGVIKWRPAPPPQPAASARPPLKRCSSARSESEGLIQGAIAYCKRSQQQLVLARKSVSDAALCSLQFQTQL